MLYCTVVNVQGTVLLLYSDKLDSRTARIPAIIAIFICCICHWTSIFIKIICVKGIKNKMQLKCVKIWSLINTLRPVGCYSHLWKKQ